MSRSEDTIVKEGLFHDLMESAPDAMIIVDESGKIVLINSQAEKIFGWPRDELVGQTLEVLIPTRYHAGHVGLRKHYFDKPAVRPMGSSLDLFGLRRNGSEFPVEVSLSPLAAEDKKYTISAIRDITDRKRVEERIRASLREKEVLLKEVHHRVKNNLQVISSIINLQAETIEDEHIKQLFSDTRARVRSIALVHERLYESKNLDNIDFKDYVEGLVRDLCESFAIDGARIETDFKIHDLSLDLDKVINCGLIVNELVTNSLKYAFPGNRPGKISISLESHDSMAVLSVSDNGIGIPESLVLGSTGTLGLMLVEGLTKELEGTLKLSSVGGATFVMTFPRQTV